MDRSAWVRVGVTGAMLMASALSLPAQTNAPSSMGDAGMRSGMRKTQGTPSQSLTLTVNGKTTELSLAELAAMPQVTITAHNGHTNADEHYSGVSLGLLLARYGLPVGKATHQQMLRSYLIAAGTDKYWVLYSVTEVEPTEHAGDVIVATSLEGKPLGADGALRLVDNDEKKPQRWVRNLRSITVKSAP